MSGVRQLAESIGVSNLSDDLRGSQLCLLVAMVESRFGISFPELLIEQCPSAEELWSFAEVISSHSAITIESVE